MFCGFSRPPTYRDLGTFTCDGELSGSPKATTQSDVLQYRRGTQAFGCDVVILDVGTVSISLVHVFVSLSLCLSRLAPPLSPNTHTWQVYHTADDREIYACPLRASNRSPRWASWYRRDLLYSGQVRSRGSNLGAGGFFLTSVPGISGKR